MITPGPAVTAAKGGPRNGDTNHGTEAEHGRCTLLTLTLPSCWLQEVENINTDDVMAAMKINKMNC